MAYKPMLFSPPMVTAILDGQKTQTRRTIKLQPHSDADISAIPRALHNENDWGKFYYENRDGETILLTPPIQVGDIIWIREKWKKNEIPMGWPYHYYAKNDTFTAPDNEKWKPGIHMPKAACRLFLKCIGVRVEKLQSISLENAISEGIKSFRPVPGDGPSHTSYFNYLTEKYELNPVYSFQSLWRSINGTESWMDNPWVWVYSFKITDKPTDFI